ncbi:hypothetical protein BMS3Bbin04_01320 [bacterium BMS3Bbin04]|nr:hypothetical protein BMS3Bbin04_01320 [bacterium BMS3Bbin04]
MSASGYPLNSAAIASCPRHLCRGLSDDEHAPVTAAGDNRANPRVVKRASGFSGLRTQNRRWIIPANRQQTRVTGACSSRSQDIIHSAPAGFASRDDPPHTRSSESDLSGLWPDLILQVGFPKPYICARNRPCVARQATSQHRRWIIPANRQQTRVTGACSSDSAPDNPRHECRGHELLLTVGLEVKNTCREAS